MKGPEVKVHDDRVTEVNKSECRRWKKCETHTECNGGSEKLLTLNDVGGVVEVRGIGEGVMTE